LSRQESVSLQESVSRQESVSGRPSVRDRLAGHRLRGSLLVSRPARRELLGSLLVLPAQAFAVPVADPVPEDGALGVVRLVLQASGQQPVAGEGDRRAVDAETGDGGVV